MACWTRPVTFALPVRVRSCIAGSWHSLSSPPKDDGEVATSAFVKALWKGRKHAHAGFIPKCCPVSKCLAMSYVAVQPHLIA